MLVYFFQDDSEVSYRHSLSQSRTLTVRPLTDDTFITVAPGAPRALARIRRTIFHGRRRMIAASSIQAR